MRLKRVKHDRNERLRDKRQYKIHVLRQWRVSVTLICNKRFLSEGERMSFVMMKNSRHETFQRNPFEMKAKTAWQRKRVGISLHGYSKGATFETREHLSLRFLSLYFIHSLCLIECKYQRNRSMRETYGESRDSSVTKKMKFSFLSLLHILFSSLDPYESQAELWFCHRVLPFVLYLLRDPQLYLRFSLHPSFFSHFISDTEKGKKREYLSLCVTWKR